MFSNQYYTLVAGLREYTLDADTKGFDIDQILAAVEESLSRSDWRIVQLLYTYYDCENIIGRYNGSSTHNSLGRMTAEQVTEELRQPTHLPERVARIVRAFANPEGEDAEDGDLVEHVEQVVRGQEVRGGDEQGQAEQDQADQRTAGSAEDLADPLSGRGLRGRAGRGGGGWC
jgi:hypothetical protein